MAMQSNPTILSQATRFSFISARSASRSPSRSPLRKAQFTAHEVDPLLSNLSPDSTLNALAQTDAVNATGSREQDLLSKSITVASPSERAFGIKAAIAGKKLREWCTELSNWEWPERDDAKKGKGFDVLAGQPDEDYIGCLPSRLADHYEERIEEIKDGLEALEVEDLKEHVLGAHVPSRSRPNSADGTHVPLSLTFGQLSDFTAVITATIVQALPFLARLRVLLNTWEARLLVIRQVPGLLENLRVTQRALSDAWDAVRNGSKASKFSQSLYRSTKAALENRIVSLGAQFDRVLDLLEGRDDALPESWIDQMDSLESDFPNWVMAAERRVLVNEWKRNSDLEKSTLEAQVSNADTTKQSSSPKSDQETHITEAEHEALASPPSEESREQPTASVIGSGPAASPLPGSHSSTIKHEDTQLPSGPLVEAGSSGLSSDAARELEVVQKESAEQRSARGPGTDGSQDYFRMPAFKTPERTQNNSRRPAALQLPTPNHRRDVSEVSVADSMLSEAFSDLSEAEILNASTAEVSTPTVVESPARRFSSVDPLTIPQRQAPEKCRPQTMHFSGLDSSQSSSPLKRRASAEYRMLSLNRSASNLMLGEERKLPMGQPDQNQDLKDRRPSTLHRASVSSVEVVPKSRVRSIVISRNNSSGSIPSPTEQSGTPADALKALVGDDSHSAQEHSEHPTRSRLSQSTTSSLSAPIGEADDTRLPSPHSSLQPASPHPSVDLPPQIPRRSSKRLTRSFDSGVPSPKASGLTEESPTHPVSPIKTSQSPHTPSKIPTPTKKSVNSPTKSTDETIEEKIQDILTTIPARIHFKTSQPTANAAAKSLQPPHSASDDLSSFPSYSTSTSSGASSTRATTPTPSLTLAPARPSKFSRPSMTSGDNADVKVYHLSRSGPNQSKDVPPLKLFVRLVGENGERVMVRVGGGWADLGEYLREYALHHGRSKPNMNDEQFEVKALPNRRQVSATSALGSSPPEAASQSKSSATSRPSVPRPASALDFSRPSPPIYSQRSSRRLSAAAAESPVRALPLSSNSLVASHPGSDNASPLPFIPPRLQSEQTIDSSPIPTPATAKSRQSSFQYFDNPSPALTPSSYNSSPITPRYTPLGAAGPVKMPKQPSRSKVPMAPNSSHLSTNSPKSPSISRPTTPGSQNSDAARVAQMPSPAFDDGWVQNVLVKARHTQHSLGPTNSLPISSSSTTAPARGRHSSFGALSGLASKQNPLEQNPRAKSRPASRLSNFGLGGGGGSKSENLAKDGSASTGPGSGSGIKRVFLRKKSSMK